MTLDQIRAFCLSLPAATEGLQWGDNLLFRVAGKMFAIADLEPGGSTGYRLSFKCTPQRAAELLERPGTAPAPYLAKHHWIALESFDTLPRTDLEEALAASYRLVVEKLPASRRPQPPPGGRLPGVGKTRQSRASLRRR
jgi:predicted DNA-binding protein (MmcQ/YjbR family)